MSETPADPRIDPKGGDCFSKGTEERHVVSRGQAGSVRFKRIVGTRMIVSQQRLGCFQRWARDAKVIS